MCLGVHPRVDSVCLCQARVPHACGGGGNLNSRPLLLEVLESAGPGSRCWLIPLLMRALFGDCDG